LAVAELLARQGAFVIGVGRSVERSRAAEARLRRLSPGSLVTYLTAELSSQQEVRLLAERIGEVAARDGTGWLDGLVNNAGTFTFWQTLTEEGFETQWAVNHLAPFLLTQQLLPLLIDAPVARIVTVSSESHQGIDMNWEDIQLRRNYSGLRAYQQTKLANILFTLELNARLGEHANVRAFAADPGLVSTDIGYKGTPAIARLIWRLRRAAAISPEESARGVVFLATEAAVAGQPGIYWRHGVPRRASARALDGAAAGRLWSLSAQMCGSS
jgi:NAD(P)-dependent dehydrogenase (short-subunit alcohol dehydrogenase family)